MYNKVILVGNLTRDIEIRYTQSGSAIANTGIQSGSAIANTGIATTRKFKANGETKEEVLFIDLTFFGRQAEVANQYLKKGSKILVEGRLILQSWTAQDGTKKSKHSIVVELMQMLNTKSNNSQTNAYQAPQQEQGRHSEKPNNSNNSGYNQTKEPTIPEIDIDDDEIPF